MNSSLPSATAPQHGPIYWTYLLPITVIHLSALLACVPWLFSWSGLALMIAGNYVFGTLGMNLCYHRLLTHRSFTTPRWFEHLLATLGICCLQDSPIRWVATHRLHHCHSDEPRDPHSPRESFLWSHIGWLLRDTAALHNLPFYHKYARDLLNDKYYLLEKQPQLTACIYLIHASLFPLAGFAVGWLASGTTAGGLQLAASWLVWGVIVRTVTVWHITWSVNSLTHVFGYRNYETTENSRNNWLVGLLAAGEGWHNNHHHDQASASVQHRWWEIDPTYYVILVLERVGLASNVIRPRHLRQAEASDAATASLPTVESVRG